MIFFVVVVIAAAVCTQTLIENINLNCFSHHHQIPFFCRQRSLVDILKYLANMQCKMWSRTRPTPTESFFWTLIFLLLATLPCERRGSSSRVVHRWTGERATLRRWSHFGSAFLHMNLHTISKLFGSQYQKVEELFSPQEGEKCTSCEEPVDAGWGGSPAK